MLALLHLHINIKKRYLWCIIRCMLSINHLSVSKGDKEILKDINLFLARNEKIGMVGVNGAGKSTL